jgi:hypothetical protein
LQKGGGGKADVVGKNVVDAAKNVDAIGGFLKKGLTGDVKNVMNTVSVGCLCVNG